MGLLIEAAKVVVNGAVGKINGNGHETSEIAKLTGLVENRLKYYAGSRELPDYHPRALAKAEVYSRKLISSQPAEAILDRTVFHYGLFHRFGLDAKSANHMAVNEALSNASNLSEEERKQHLWQMVATLLAATDLDYDPQAAIQLTLDTNDRSFDREQRISAHANLHAVTFGLNGDSMPHLIEASQAYFQALDFAGLAMEMKDFEGHSSAQWMGAERSFTRFYTKLESVRMNFSSQ